jgi:hypothetical protein
MLDGLKYFSTHAAGLAHGVRYPVLVYSATGKKDYLDASVKRIDDALKLNTHLSGGAACVSEYVAPVASTTKEVKEVDESYRTEKVVLSEGAEGSLKAYSVVCGSFGVKANADNLRKSLLGEGYNAIVVQNPATGMYRVVCASYDSRQEAAQARAQFKAAHPDNSDFQKAWLLYNK